MGRGNSVKLRKKEIRQLNKDQKRKRMHELLDQQMDEAEERKIIGDGWFHVTYHEGGIQDAEEHLTRKNILDIPLVVQRERE